MNEKLSSLMAGLLSAPWCWVAPAVFSLLGLAGVGTARVMAAKLSPVFLATAILLLGRAHYIIHVKKHRTRASRIIVWIATIAAAGLWIWRL